MASTGEEYGLFWNSNDGDRTYSADSFEYWLKKFFTSGVFNGDMQVTASSGMTLNVGSGYANVDGKVKFWNDSFTVTLDAANSTRPRIDTIVITRDNVNREIICEKVTGAYSADNPQPTAPVRNSEKYQLVLAQIYVDAGTTSIAQEDITDTRAYPDLCGWVTGTVEEMDFSQFAAQFESYYARFVSESNTEYATWKNNRNADYVAWKAEEQTDYSEYKQAFKDDSQAWRQGEQTDHDAWESDFENDSETWKDDFQATLEAWYTQMQGQISSDAAVNLQTQINALKYFFVQDGILYIPNTRASVVDGILVVSTT